MPLTKEYLLRALPQSSERIAAAQARFRTPLLDTIFLWSGMVRRPVLPACCIALHQLTRCSCMSNVQLGAVGFFMCFLPAFFFFGYGCVHRLVAANRQRDTE